MKTRTITSGPRFEVAAVDISVASGPPYKSPRGSLPAPAGNSVGRLSGRITVRGTNRSRSPSFASPSSRWELLSPTALAGHAVVRGGTDPVAAITLGIVLLRRGWAAILRDLGGARPSPSSNRLGPAPGRAYDRNTLSRCSRAVRRP